MLCSVCNFKLESEASFCPSCGSAATQAPRETMEVKGRFRRRSVFFGITAGTAILLAFALFVAAGIKDGVTKSNVFDYLATAESLGMQARQLTTAPDFSYEIEDSCSGKSQILRLLSSGKTWGSVSLQSAEGASDGFHLKQRIFEANSEAEAATLVNLFQSVATDSSCDTTMSGGEMIFGVLYENSRSIEKGFGIPIQGYAFDIRPTFCFDGCSDLASSTFLVATKGKVVNLIKFGGGSSNYFRLKPVVTELLKKYSK